MFRAKMKKYCKNPRIFLKNNAETYAPYGFIKILQFENEQGMNMMLIIVNTEISMNTE